MRFSQRHGYSLAEKAIQFESMDEELRSGLWNAVHIYLWEEAGIGSWQATRDARIYSAISYLWHSFFKRPLDTIPYKLSDTIKQVRHVFFTAKWFAVYDFLEFNSIKESISAVEGLCRCLTGDDKATLGAALSILEKQGVHP